MVVFSYKQIKFHEREKVVRAYFLRSYYFEIPKEKLLNIGKFSVEDGKVEFPDVSEKKASKFNQILSDGFNNMINTITGKKTVYIHKNSGIPLIGSNVFGLVDRGSNLIEIKPMTGCNLNCVYCSICEGKESNKEFDFVVEKDYMIDEIKKIIEFKGRDDIEAHIGTHGEPMLYLDIVELIRDLKKIKEVKVVSIDTNGMLLTKESVDDMKRAGLTRFNLSIDAIDPIVARKVANAYYDIKKVQKIVRYIAKTMDITITPLWVPELNDNEIEKLIKFAEELKQIKYKYNLEQKSPIIGIQNFLEYKFGRKPAKQKSWDKFYTELENLEEKHCIKLIIKKEDFNIKTAKALPKPFVKGEVIDAIVLCHGKLKNEMIAAAKERSISVINCSKRIGQKVKIKIVRSKHNVYVGVEV
ncbi:radical SAM protein [Nanoarchaeota archaeon]